MKKRRGRSDRPRDLPHATAVEHKLYSPFMAVYTALWKLAIKAPCHLERQSYCENELLFFFLLIPDWTSWNNTRFDYISSGMLAFSNERLEGVVRKKAVDIFPLLISIYYFNHLDCLLFWKERKKWKEFSEERNWLDILSTKWIKMAIVLVMNRVHV